MDIRAPTLPVNAGDAYTDINSLNNIKNDANSDSALKKVAQQFEQLFVHEMLKNMRSANAVFEEDSLFNSSESNFFRDMYDQQLSLDMSKKGIGLADSLYAQMRSQQGAQESSAEAAAALDTTAPARKAAASPYHQSSAVDATEQPAPAAPFANAREFVEAVLPQAKKAAKALGLNPLLLAAQAALETGWGKFMVSDEKGQNSHNLFNIKADGRWQGEKMDVATTEFYGGQPIKEQASFRAYESFDQSFDDFVNFLQNNPRYQPALAAAGDPEQFMTQLHQAGYATDPNYSSKVLSVFNQLTRDGFADHAAATE